jgi:hypothetical protein
VKGDDSIGWDELSDTLAMTLAQIMGDEEFCSWNQCEIWNAIDEVFTFEDE